MKKIIIAIFLLFNVCFQQTSYAQSMCAGISTTSFPLNPQSGSYNYFGVKITLDMTYAQNVTVSGYIYEDSYNTNTPFSLTINAGDLTNETSATFFAGNPTLVEPRITISSVSPSTLTSNGVSFNTACSSSDPIDRLNAIGQLHNEYMDYVLGYISSQNMDFNDTSSLKSTMQTKTNTFLTNHGFSTATLPMNFGGLAAITNFSYTSGNYSTAGASILSSLHSLIASYDPDNDTGFLSSLTSLQTDALGLSDPNEVYTVGIPVTVAMYSYTYWKNNAQAWSDTFCAQDSIRHSATAFVLPQIDNYSQSISLMPENIEPVNFSSYEQTSRPMNQMDGNKAAYYFRFKLGGGQLIAADVGGAITGAIDGALLGPGGALAGGILGSAGASIGNIAGQLMGHFFSWW